MVEVPALVGRRQPETDGEGGTAAMMIRSARRSRTRSSTWRASSTRAIGEDDDELLAAVAARDVDGTERVPEDLGEGPQRAVAGGVPERVVQLLEMVEVAVGHRVRRAGGGELPDGRLQAPPRHQAREGVAVGLGLGDLEGAQHRQPLRCPAGDHLDVRLYRVRGWRTVLRGHVEDPHGAAADAHRDTQGGAAPAPQVGAGVERRALGEHHGPGPRCGRAVVGGHDAAADIVRLLAADEHLAEVGRAGVGQQQLGPHARSSLAERLRHQVEDGCLGLRHLQRGLQARLELDPPGQVGLHGVLPWPARAPPTARAG